MYHHRRRRGFLSPFVLFCQNYLRFSIPLSLPEFAALSMMVGLLAWQSVGRYVGLRGCQKVWVRN